MRTCKPFDSALSDLTRRCALREDMDQLEKRCLAIGLAYGVSGVDVARLAAAESMVRATPEDVIMKVWHPC